MMRLLRQFWIFTVRLLLYRATVYVVPSECGYGWYGPDRVIYKCGMLKRELILDANLKVTGFKFIKRTYSKNYQFTLGEQYFHVKMRYQKMMNLYIEMESEVTKEYQVYRTKLLVEIQRLAMEANQMTLMIEEGDGDLMKRKERHLKFMNQLRAGKDDAATDMAANKTVLRSQMRARGFARRNRGGRLPNALPPKFQRRGPKAKPWVGSRSGASNIAKRPAASHSQ